MPGATDAPKFGHATFEAIIREVLAAGADSVAVIADLLKAPDIGQRARDFLRELG